MDFLCWFVGGLFGLLNAVFPDASFLPFPKEVLDAWHWALSPISWLSAMPKTVLALWWLLLVCLMIYKWGTLFRIWRRVWNFLFGKWFEL